MDRRSLCSIIALTLIAPTALRSAQAAEPSDTDGLQAAQRDALARLNAFHGAWRGPATVIGRDGKTVQLIQTERVGPMLSDTLRVIEGRGHREDGSVAFNALAIISFDPQTGKYNFRSHAQGHEGDFPLEVGDGEFAWRIQAGPAVIRYAATVKDGVWSEVGERTLPGQPPVRIFEMKLRRVGSTDWPVAGAIPP